jgi:response regulator RpfG family c-di-GMP phosphodiesterase
VAAYNVLVVDDEVNSLNMLERTLRRDYNVFSATNGENALAIMERNDIALVIADHRMPGMTGVELLQKILQKHPNTIRLILTAYPDQKLLLNTINKVHAHGFLIKPCNPQEVEFTVRKWIEAYETMAKLEEKAKRVEKVQRQLEGAKQLVTQLTHQLEHSQRLLDHRGLPGRRRFRRLKEQDQGLEDEAKEQFVAELIDLRRRIADFEGSEVDFMQVMKIGEVLIEMGCLTFSQLQRILQRQKEDDTDRDKRLGQMMIEAGLITKEELDEALAEQRSRLTEK